MKKAFILMMFIGVLSLYFKETVVEDASIENEQIEKIASCQLNREMNREINQKTVRINEMPNSASPLWIDDEESLRKIWGIQAYHQILREEFQSPLGASRVYRFSQGGVPIVGMLIRVSRDISGQVREEENTYRSIPELALNSTEMESRALEIKAHSLNGGRYEPSHFELSSAVIFVRKNLTEGQLAFALSAKDHGQDGGRVQLLVRASDGKVIQKTFGRKEFHF
jgi:hypothetical protein